MREHDLKTWPEAFEAVRAGEKTFEVRRNDRAFLVGDLLVLREWDPALSIYTGRRERRRVAYILDGGQFGVEAGFVVMALAVPASDNEALPQTPADLAAWHAARAQNARLRAANWRSDAGGAGAVIQERYLAAATAADEEAAYHDAAANIALSGRPAR